MPAPYADCPYGEVHLKQSDMSWDLCGRAAAEQALLRWDLSTDPHLQMLPG